MKRALLFILIISAVGVGLWFTQTFYDARQNQLNAQESGVPSMLENVSPEDFFPEPLKKLATGQSTTPSTALGAQAIVTLTNAERIKNGRKALVSNPKLALAAHRKILDMVNLQYFEHTSPSGKGPADIIEAAGYAYVIVGENLAEGDFVDNADLVQGWMNSPGHRANILNEKYTEIGVATERGILNGKQVWFAVQEFGRPLTDCPRIDQTLKTQITTNETQVQTLQVQLQHVQTRMNEAKQKNDINSYNNLVPQYNTIVNSINALVAKTKQIVSTYNTQVKSFNTCIE